MPVGRIRNLPGISAPLRHRLTGFQQLPVHIEIPVIVGVALQGDGVFFAFGCAAGAGEGGRQVGHRLLGGDAVDVLVQPQLIRHVLSPLLVDVDVLVGHFHPRNRKGIGDFKAAKALRDLRQPFCCCLLGRKLELLHQVGHLVDANLKAAVRRIALDVPGHVVVGRGLIGWADLVEQVHTSVLGVQVHGLLFCVHFHLDDGVELVQVAVAAQQVVPRLAHGLQLQAVLRIEFHSALEHGHAGLDLLRLGILHDGEPARQAGGGTALDFHVAVGKINNHKNTSL